MSSPTSEPRAPRGYHAALNRAIYAGLGADWQRRVDEVLRALGLSAATMEGFWLHPHHRLGLLVLPDDGPGYAFTAAGPRLLSDADFE